MRKYEVMYVLRPDLEQEATKELVEKFQSLITNNGGEIEKQEEMGKRRLAYEIKGYHEGYYVLVNFQSEPSVVAELDRVLKITDGVIRFLIVKDVK
ncbi:30S ribosomal protein S6 [Tepidibacillus infernus]|uniref:Small ribosomal subunit protein bS6 n=1 Tax=Tepidibacillus decaturensis TaxID=1413211 RepID=A0A135L6Z2_9BACI|nr:MULTISPECIES: 30S ribosomal protein S6 [Tepidibacillus]KXG44774.1 30S ribosomal protein S6 [Tepidibacillus decaturensis]GBF11539.1 30S ribosomal protein S6 [Tepidibacillus sp. HK-1]